MLSNKTNVLNILVRNPLVPLLQANLISKSLYIKENPSNILTMNRITSKKSQILAGLILSVICANVIG